MKIRLLHSNYLKSDKLYQDFLNDNIDKPEHYSNQLVDLDHAPFFPIYINIRDENERDKEYRKAYQMIRDNYMDIDRELTLDGDFWYSLLLTKFRNNIIEKYPQVLEKESDFKNVIMKKFDWENYIYKVVLASQYLDDYVEEGYRNHYFDLILDNLDLYNYILKGRIFRNGKFLYNILRIIEKHDLSQLLKAKIKDRPDLGKDERYGRRVIFEFNKDYPVVMGPMLDFDNLEKKFLEYLNMYKGTIFEDIEYDSF